MGKICPPYGNLIFRVCGRSDNVLSQITQDNASIAEQIPKDARDRFSTGDGTVLQGYLFNDGGFKTYRKGKNLTTMAQEYRSMKR